MACGAVFQMDEVTVQGKKSYVGHWWRSSNTVQCCDHHLLSSVIVEHDM